MNLSRSSFALKLSLMKLLRDAYEPSGFYLITLAEKRSVMPSWREIGDRHRNMLRDMNDQVKARRLRKYAGLRVFEEGDETKRPHAHWVLTPRISQRVIQQFAYKHGFGYVFLHPNPPTLHLCDYLGEYMSKGRLQGVRRWACFGAFRGVRVQDIITESNELRDFRKDFEEAKQHVDNINKAYVVARVKANLRKYGRSEFNGSTLQEIPMLKNEVTTVMKSGEVRRQQNA